MPSNFAKQLQQLQAYRLNTGTGATQIGGTLTGVPSGVTASQGIQDIPGDRIVLGEADALALSDKVNGISLFCGIYMYVLNGTSSTAATLGHVAFWQASNFSTASSTYPTPDNLYAVTPTELGSSAGITPPIAGVFINALAGSAYGWIQTAGRATGSFGATTGSILGNTTTFVINAGVYAGGYGTSAGSGLLTQINAVTFPNADSVLDAIATMHMGVADVAPSASSNSIFSLKLQLYRL